MKTIEFLIPNDVGNTKKYISNVDDFVRMIVRCLRKYEKNRELESEQRRECIINYLIYMTEKFETNDFEGY